MTNTSNIVKNNYITSQIALKLHENFEIKNLEVIDETDSHKKHKHYKEGKFHIKIVIEANQLQNIATIEAHRQINTVLTSFLQNNLHALSIKIIK